MCNIPINPQADNKRAFESACSSHNLEKVEFYLQNDLIDIDSLSCLFLNIIDNNPGFYRIMGCLIDQGFPKDYYLFSLPELMKYELEEFIINYYEFDNEYVGEDITIALNLGVLVNGMDATYYNKTALDIFFEKFKETDPEYQMPLVQKLIGLGAKRFSDLTHQERVLNSDIMTAMQYSLEDLKVYFAHRKEKGWNYPNRLPSAIFSIRKAAAKQNHLNFKTMLDKVEFIAFQYPTKSAFDVLRGFLTLNHDETYSVSSSYSPTELYQVIKMLFHHEELSWQFKLSEMNNPQLLDEIATYLCSGGYHEVAEQFLAKASLV